MAEKFADNVLMVMSIVLIVMGFGIALIGALSLFVHGFSWLTLAWTIGAYVVSGLMFSVISRSEVSGINWSAG